MERQGRLHGGGGGAHHDGGSDGGDLHAGLCAPLTAGGCPTAHGRTAARRAALQWTAAGLVARRVRRRGEHGPAVTVGSRAGRRVGGCPWGGRAPGWR